jgi:hypothetical protein
MTADSKEGSHEASLKDQLTTKIKCTLLGPNRLIEQKLFGFQNKGKL